MKTRIPFLILLMATAGCASRGASQIGGSGQKVAAVGLEANEKSRLGIEGIREGQTLTNISNVSVSLVLKNAEGQEVKSPFKAGVFVNRELALIFVGENREKILLPSSSFFRGPNLVTVVLLSGDETPVRGIATLSQVGFNITDSKAQAPETSARIQKNEGILLLNPRGVYRGTNGVKLRFDVLNLDPKIPVENFSFRYSLNGETRQVQGAGPFYFQNLPPGKYQLKVWNVDKNGNSQAGSFFNRAESEFVVEI